MSENNKTYRLRTKVGITETSPIEDRYLTVKLTDEIESIDIMSLKIKQENAYRFHSSDYGVIVGRAIANGGFGVPNVKVSVFIAASDATKQDSIYNAIYPYTRVTQKNKDNIRYNLLPDVGNDDCYQVVGTFPNKRLVLDDDNYMEIYDTYYKFTTKTNNAGDYMIFGVPTGGQVLHFDTDLSDVGVLSQRPRDMIYKGYNINQFENANQFRVDDNLANLPQIISQDDSVYVYPFWGEEDENIIGITRHDININYKFEPTCVFIGSVVTDTASNHISKKCIPTESMGIMDEMIAGSGTIEMIRKKLDGGIEQYNIQGNQLINDNGVWCYQIPMNLDYAMTDEYGNIVPSNDPTKGIATRASVRFRFAMQDFDNDSANSFRAKVLVPSNPRDQYTVPDYAFGTFTEDDSFRDLLWNNVYTVKSFIPRFQKGDSNRNRRFSGIKQCNYHGVNNPVPYNNMRINLSFQFIITCLLVRLLIWAIGLYNGLMTMLSQVFGKFPNLPIIKGIKSMIRQINRWPKLLKVIVKVVIWPFTVIGELALFMERVAKSLSCIYIDGSLCESIEGTWYFAPGCGKKKTAAKNPYNFLWKNMMAKIEGKKTEQSDFTSQKSSTGGGYIDKNSVDSSNADDINDPENGFTVTIKDPENNDGVSAETFNYAIARGIDYFVQCVEISLAQTFKVIKFDFYNDWINGMIYIPRWERTLKRKRKFFLFGKSRIEVRACNDSYSKRFFERRNYITEQCAVSYKAKLRDNSVVSPVGCKNNKKYKCHKKHGRHQHSVFTKGGAVHAEITSYGLYAYYFKPCEYVTDINRNTKRINLFATDIVLLGSLNECNLNGTPAFSGDLPPTSYQLPGPLAQTDSSEEGFTYGNASALTSSVLYEDNFSGVFIFEDSVLNPKDDGSVTERAGIDWSYTGPGQGKMKKSKTYTPGGHFLGISCVNAESNIKSCVNLKRICEANVNMSVRQEAFNGYADKTGVNGRFIDIIPHGLISKDEIYDGDFRKMFATMNFNGLKTRVNSSGFTVYDFTYVTPDNFGGEMRKYVGANYNDPDPVPNMDKYLAKNGDMNDYGETWDYQWSESDDIELKPVRRALEDMDNDYVKFRFGLPVLTNATFQKKFLGSDERGFYLPVYDNSYYFYFGIKPGATAIEEFRKLFFAECKPTTNTTDNRLRATLIYKINGKEVDAFAEDIIISIFDKNLDARTTHPTMKVFTSAIPVKITVDNEKSLTIGASSNIMKTYVETDGDMGDGNNLFTLDIGRHVVTITDADGRITTKIVNVIREDVTLCPEKTEVPFRNTDYVINSTESLVRGTAPGRETLGGWVSFDWSKSQCEDPSAFFTYGDEDPVNVITSADTGLCLVFAGRSHLIKVGTAWSDSKILSYPVFSGYSTIIEGVTKTGAGDNHIYAGESTVYKMYLLYKTGGKETPEPILIDENVEIGEPDTIDFDIFREVLESEEDSPVTYRNPIIKLWFAHPDDWFGYLYSSGELTYDQIWYIKKNIFYIFSGYASDYDSDEEMNEYFPTKRDLFINTYYNSTIGDVEVRVLKNGGSEISTSVLQTVQPGDIYNIRISGRTEDGTIINVPKQGAFRFPIKYKPYYYRAVVWEGYSVFSEKELLVKDYFFAHTYGDIFNGITYDRADGRTVFGNTLLNEKYDLTDNVNVNVVYLGDTEIMGNNERVTNFAYDNNETFFDDADMTLTIIEGAPDVYDSTYPPVEYTIIAQPIGNSSNWEVHMSVAYNLDPRTREPIEAKVKVLNTSYDFEELYYYTPSSLNPRFYNDYEFGEFAADGRKQATNNYPTEDGDVWGFEYDYNRDTKMILCESVAYDHIEFRDGVTNLGYLKSRNLIRNNMTFNFILNKTSVAYSSQFYVAGVIWPFSSSGEFILMKLVFYLDLEDKKLMSDIANTTEDIIVTTTDGKTFKLLTEMGYYAEYATNKGLSIVINEYEEGEEEGYIPVIDDFTRIFTSGGSMVNRGSFQSFEIISSGIGDSGKVDDVSYKNTLDGLSLKYENPKWVATIFNINTDETQG